MLRVLVIVGLVVVAAEATGRPKYLNPCSLSDPQLNACAKKHGNEAIPSIVEGDKEYRIPNMRPLKIPEVNMQPSGNLKVKFTDCKVYGLERTQIKDFEIDPKAQKVKITLYINEVSMQADYDINGQILILPIQGKGPANIKFVDGEYLFQFDWEVVERKGEKFAKIVNPKLTYETKRSYYRLDNLFNGDKLLGEETNRFLDENWQDINKDLGPAISETISQICVTIASNFFDRISYDQLFLP